MGRVDGVRGGRDGSRRRSGASREIGGVDGVQEGSSTPRDAADAIDIEAEGSRRAPDAVYAPFPSTSISSTMSSSSRWPMGMRMFLKRTPSSSASR